MNNEEKKERLRGIVNAKTMSADDKTLILEICDELQVPKPAKKNCRACWIETAISCYNALGGEEPKEPATDRKYVLKNGVDLIFGHTRVNAATLTDELAEKIIARGFSKKWFKKCE